MTQQRANQRALAAARITENLAYALPGYLNDLEDRWRSITGHPDHHPGAAPPTTTPSRPLTGICGQPTTLPDLLETLLRRVAMIEARLYDEDLDVDVDAVIDCTLDRPCPDHDVPVALTRPERATDQRMNIDHDIADAEQVISTITLLANELLARARRAVPVVPIAVPLCNGGQGREGWLVPQVDGGWSDLTCRRPAERKGGICSACYMRERRYRERVGLPAREREGEVSYNV
jgi:hypothetical protein